MADPIPIVPPPPISRRVEPVVPVLARRGRFVPVVGGFLTITLPGEGVRAKVVDVKSDDIAIVELQGVVGIIRGGHQYKSSDIVAVQRSEAPGQLQEIWVPISDREVRMQEEAERLATQAALTAASRKPAEPIPEEDD